jgi:hypothetical protein
MFKRKYGLKEWFERLPEMSLEEKFTLFAVQRQGPPLYQPYLVLCS